MEILAQRIIRKLPLCMFGPRQTAQKIQNISYQALFADEKTALAQSLERRGWPTCLKSLRESWAAWSAVATRFEALEARREAISGKTQDLMAQLNGNSPELAALKAEGKVIRQEMKLVAKEYHEAVKAASVCCLSLPNLVHDKTPGSSLLTHVYGERPALQGPGGSRLEGLNASLQPKWVAPGLFFTKGVWGQLELKLSRYVAKHLAKHGFQALSAPEFVRSAIAEGCSPHFLDPAVAFLLESKSKGTADEAALHLVGASSVPAQSALLAKSVTTMNAGVGRWCSIGRSYAAQGNLLQSNQVQLAVAGQADLFAECEMTEMLLTKLYHQLDMHFRVRHVPAQALASFEQFKAVFEMFAPARDRFVAVGALSYVGDYVSHRLLCRDDAQQPLYTLMGTAMDVTQFVACLMEYHSPAQVDAMLDRVKNTK